MRWNRNFLLRLTLLVALAPLATAQKPGPRQPMVNLPAPGHPGDEILITTNRIPQPETQKSKGNDCLQAPLDSIRSSVIAAEQLRIPAKATREYHRACSDLRKKRSSDAERHLRNAVQEYPKYATAWVMLGQMLANENRSEDARNACDRAAAADPIYVPAQLCLAEIASRTHDWSEELKHALRTLEIDPNSLLAYEYQAAANANLQNLDEAERSGLRAIEHDKCHNDPAAHLVMAQIYKMKGETASEEEQLREYLKYTHNAERAAQVKQILAKLEDGLNEDVEISDSGTARDKSGRLAQRWELADVDEAGPPLPDDATCPLPKILEEVSQRMTELVDNLQRFSATEEIEHVEFGKNGRPRKFKSTSELFTYVAQIEQNPYQGFWVYEYRMSERQTDPPPLADTGTAALALLFHPRAIGNLEIHCEGRADLKGVTTWQLRFEERPDPSRAFSSLRTKTSEYRVRLKGRAWISADNYQVSRLQTDLVAPIPEIRLDVQHFDVAYAPVGFLRNKFRLWLPESASMDIVYNGHRYQRLHTFSHFQLFLVGTEQRVKEPPSSKRENLQ